MTQLKYAHGVDGVTCNTPCPNVMSNSWGTIYVGSGACAACRHYLDTAGPDEINCDHHEPNAPCSILTNRERDPEGIHMGRDGPD